MDQEPTQIQPEPTPQQPPVEPAAPDGATSPPPLPTPGNRISPRTPGNGPQENVGKKPNKGKLVAVVIIVVLILAGGGWALWKYVLHKAKPAVNTNPVAVKNDIPLLRYGDFEGAMNTFYPKTDTDNITLNMNTQIFEGLVSYQDRTKIVPNLATSWTNPDDSTWVFKLRSGVKYHDGNTMTAADVKSSIAAIKQNADFNIYDDSIKSVDAVDDQTVKITTNAPDPVLLNKLAFLFVIDSKGPATAKPYDLGSGPYTVKTGTTPDEDNVDLVAFDGYHGGHIYTREVTYKLYTDPNNSEAQALADLKAGKLDFAGFFTDIKNINSAKSAGLSSLEVPDLNVPNLIFNTKKAGSPLQKLGVRQAIYETIDIPALLKAIGRDNPANTPATQVVTKEIPGYNPAITRPAVNLDHAKQLLAQAGYPNGVTITLTAATVASDVANELARQLKTVGITLKLDLQPPNNQLFAFVQSGKVEMFYSTLGPDFLDGAEVFAQAYQTPNYSNATINALLDQAGKTTDSGKRLQILQQVSKLGMDDLAVAPLYYRVNEYLAKSNLVLHQDQPNLASGVYFYKVYSK